MAITDAGMANNSRPFSQYDQTISPTQEDNGGTGGDDRPIQGEDRGNFSAGGLKTVSKVDYPIPSDPHAPEGYPENGDSANIPDYGLNENVEVGMKDGKIHNFGLSDKEVGTSPDPTIANMGFQGSTGPRNDKNVLD